MRRLNLYTVLAAILSMGAMLLLGGCGGSSGDTSTASTGSGSPVVAAGKALEVISIAPASLGTQTPEEHGYGDISYQLDCSKHDPAGILAWDDNVNNPTDNISDGSVNVALNVYQNKGDWFLDWNNLTNVSYPIYSVFVDSNSQAGGYLYVYDGSVSADSGLYAQGHTQPGYVGICYGMVTSDDGGNDYQGCTLGYWGATKQGAKAGEVVHEDNWPSPYIPTWTLSQSEVGFVGAPNPNNTLLEALHYKGGPTLDDKKNLLLKQAVAGLLSAAHPDVNYPISEAEIISQVNAALASDDQGQILGLQETLNAYNNMGCPLN